MGLTPAAPELLLSCIKELNMKASDLLKQQHREVEQLFAAIEKAEGSGREQTALFAELAAKLDAHTKIEEKIFYPAGREADEETTLEAYEEHALVDATIRKIKKTKPSDETFMAKMTVLKELVGHHVEEEEDEYFPECEKTLGAEKMEELGEELAEAYEKLIGRTQGKSGTRSIKTSSKSSGKHSKPSSKPASKRKMAA